jgi:hypothetical protein
MKTNGHSPNLVWELEEAKRLHKQWLESLETKSNDERSLDIQAEQVAKQYAIALKIMSSQITASLSCYDLHAMASGIVILVQVLGWLVYGEVYQRNVMTKRISMVDFVPTATACLIMGATFMVVLGVHVTVCSSALVSGKLTAGLQG